MGEESEAGQAPPRNVTFACATRENRECSHGKHCDAKTVSRAVPEENYTNM
jgi:hypothetical protein